MINRSRLEAILSTVVDVQRHETSALLHSSSCFFFILSAYFVVLPLRDEGAISLGLSHLPGLFVGSLVLTLIAAPVSTLIFSLPNLSKARALVLIHRFFSVSLIAFFILWHSSSTGYSTSNWKDSISGSSIAEQVPTVDGNQGSNASSFGWGAHSWFYISVRIGLFLWIALFNLITISSTWARVIDVMDTEVHVFTYKLSELFDLIACLTFLYNQSGSRLFGFIGAGATLGQLFGSLFATGMAWLGSFLLLFAALLMELAAQSSKGICEDVSCLVEEQSFTVESETDQHHGKYSSRCKGSSLRPNSSSMKPQIWTLLDGLWLILSSTYLIYVSLFLWMSAVVSSFFYFQKVSIIAMSATSAVGRRKLFAQINSFIAVFIFAGQITLTGRILTVAGITIAICASPLVAVLNLITLAVWPSWIVVAISETLRKVVTYVVTRPGRELLFTVVSQEEKYKAKVCIDVIVQRLGDATAAGMFELLVGTLNGKTSTVSLYALPACLLWMITALHLGRQHQQRIKLLDVAGHLENSVREGCR